MINPKDILKMAKAALRHGQGYPERRLLHPYREWLIGISIFAVLLIIGSIAAGLLFVHYQNIDERVVVTEKRIPTYQTGAVSDVLTTYQARRDAFEALQVEVAPMPVATGSSTDAGIPGRASSPLQNIPTSTPTSTSPADNATSSQNEAAVGLQAPSTNDGGVELAN